MASIVEESDNKAMTTLASLEIDVACFAHEPCLTIDDSLKYMGHIPDTNITKNLFIKDKKHGLFLVTVMHDREVNLKNLGMLLGLSGANLRFADAEILQNKLKIIKGAVSALSLVNDEENEIKFAIDCALMSTSKKMHCHPLRSDRTVLISPDEISTLMKHLNHEITLLDFVEGATAPPAAAKVAKAPKQGKGPKPQKEKKAATGEEGGKVVKKETQLGLSVTKEEDFSLWYTQVITASEMIDYSDISGCYILRPWSYGIWEQIQGWFDGQIKQLDVQNTYFPMFVSERALNTEKEHVEGFAPEVAWVTKCGSSDMAEPIAIRPTSETIMYPFFAKWIRSHRDLPLQLNQWCNVVRWEFKDATPFLRSREFLWQEGHTAHSTYDEAQARVLSILDLYESVYQDLLAVPVIKGIKTEMEKFAGGSMTTTVEAYIHGSGRSVQGATSHNLGQNFGKMFKILYEDEDGGRSIPWQTSWGLTTRSIGVMVMVHGDDKGLVLPPRVAPVQVVILPIIMKDSDEKGILDYAYEVKKVLKKAGVRVDVDSRKNYTPGWKFNHWEQKGVPLRMEIGPRDVANKQCRVVRRDNSEKQDISIEGEFGAAIQSLLTTIQGDMLARAVAARADKIVKVYEWKHFVPNIEKQCMVLTPFCDTEEWEEKVKKMSRDEALRGGFEEDTCATSVAAKTLCKPFNQPELPEGTKCFVSGLPATAWVLWGRSY